MAESISEFRERARTWLESRAPRRTAAEAPQQWGEGEFSVVVFHDASDEEELELLERIPGVAPRQVGGRPRRRSPCPQEFGGMGLTKGHDAAFKELEAEFDVPRDHELISVTSKLIAPTIDEFGTPEQRDRWCRKFFQLDEFCCQLFSEPGAGSDLAGLACKAVRDGDEWVLDGQKVWTSTARIAQYGFADLPHRRRRSEACRADRLHRPARCGRRRGPTDPADVGRRVVQRGVPQRRPGRRRAADRRRRRGVEGGAHGARARALDLGLEPPRRRVRRVADARPASRPHRRPDHPSGPRSRLRAEEAARLGSGGRRRPRQGDRVVGARRFDHQADVDGRHDPHQRRGWAAARAAIDGRHRRVGHVRAGTSTCSARRATGSPAAPTRSSATSSASGCSACRASRVSTATCRSPSSAEPPASADKFLESRLQLSRVRKRAAGGAMVATPLTELGRRLLANVAADRGDFADSMMTVPVEQYRDPGALRARGRCRVPAQPADGGACRSTSPTPATSRRSTSPTARSS